MPKIPTAVGVAGGRRYGQNIDRQARRLPVIGRDAGQHWLAERLLSNCTSSTTASRKIPLVRCCVPASVLRTKRRCSARRTLLDWSSDCPNFVLSGTLLLRPGRDL